MIDAAGVSATLKIAIDLVRPTIEKAARRVAINAGDITGNPTEQT